MVEMCSKREALIGSIHFSIWYPIAQWCGTCKHDQRHMCDTTSHACACVWRERKPYPTSIK